MTKKKRTLILVLLPVLLLLSLWAWFARSQTAEHLFPALRWESVNEIGGSFELYEADASDGSLKTLCGSIDARIDAANPEAQTLITALRSATFHRSLSGLFPAKSRNSGPIHAGDFVARASLFGEEFYLNLEFWFDELTLTYYSEDDGLLEYRCSTRDQETLAAQVIAFLQSHATEQTYLD